MDVAKYFEFKDKSDTYKEKCSKDWYNLIISNYCTKEKLDQDIN